MSEKKAAEKMLSSTKTKTKKSSVSKENKNVKKVISVKRGLRQPKMVKSKLACKVSNAEIGIRQPKKRKDSTRKIRNRNTEDNSDLDKSKNCTSKLKKPLPKTNNPHKKLNGHLHPSKQNKMSDKENSLKTSSKHPKDLKKNNSGSRIFVCLDNTDEHKRYKNKFREPTSARKLKRLRENLWKKSSYHKRFLGKNGVVKSQRIEKNKTKMVRTARRRLSSKQGDSNFHESGDKNSTVSNEKKTLEQNAAPKKPSSQDDSRSKKEQQINPELLPVDSKKSSKEDVSTIDERYMKSLLSVANWNNKPEKTETEHQPREVRSKGTKTDKMKITGKEFFINKIKNKKNALEYNGQSLENKTSRSLESDEGKSRQSSAKEKTNSGSVLRDATKSETEIKLWKMKMTDAKNKDIKTRSKKSYSKHEMKGLQQKKKTRNIVKNKMQDNIEIPFLCDVIKTGEVQELWKRENSAKLQNSRSSDSSTAAENPNSENIKDLGMESYQMLQQFVAEEVYRISKKYTKNDLQNKEMENNKENRDKELSKGRNLIAEEKQFSHLISKKLTAKSRENLLQGEKRLGNAENLKSVSLLHGGNPQSVKSKLNLLQEKKSAIKKIPDEIIKSWSIVNRLEQAFLALGTPSFRKAKEGEPPATNAKGARTIYKNTPEVKKIDKKIKEAEKKENKPLTRTTINRPKLHETNKSTEKQLRVLHRKESTTSNRKSNTPTSIPSTKSAKIEEKPKPKEEKSRLQPPSPLSKPPTKPNSKFTSKSGIKPPTPVENLCSSWNKILGSQQIGKVGKKNSPRNHLSESSTQNKNDDNLERKKTFQVISLKDSVIMQPRRSKSCNKVDRNSEVDKKNGLSPTRSQEYKSLTSLKEKTLDFCDHLKETEKMNEEEEEEEEEEEKVKDKEVETEQKHIPPILTNSTSKDFSQISEISRNSSRENVKDVPSSKLNEEIMCDQTPPQEISEQGLVTKDKNHSSKTRAIKERSILSIRTKKHEKQTSRTNITQIQEECTPLLFQADTPDLPKTDDLKDSIKVFLPPAKVNCSETSITSLSNFDLESSNSSIKDSAKVIANDDELKLLKAPSVSLSKSTQIIASQTSTLNKRKPEKITKAPWEQDINYYRALVKEIMSQYKRLDGFLKQSENVKALPEDLEEFKPSEDQVGVLKEKVSIQEYRKKIMLEYQEVPILEYKTQMAEIQKKLDGRWKRRNLLVIQPINGEVDLDVKDYEPRMRTVLDSRLYFDKENFRRRLEISRNLKEKKLSLQEVIFRKEATPINCPNAIFTPKSCLCYTGPSTCSDEKPEEKCRDVDSYCLVSTSNVNNP